jgi:hypothetical protein
VPTLLAGGGAGKLFCLNTVTRKTGWNLSKAAFGVSFLSSSFAVISRLWIAVFIRTAISSSHACASTSAGRSTDRDWINVNTLGGTPS